MRITGVISTITICMFSAACSTTVRTPVAQQALGPSAITVDITSGQTLKAPAIYRVSDKGEFSQICSDDFRLQTALQAITVQERSSSDVIYDQMAGSTASVTILGSSVTLPYSQTKIDGYKITTALTPGAESLEDYILNNLGPNCPKEVLAKAPYLIVSDVAVAERAYTVRQEAIRANIAIGTVGSVAFSSDENIEGPRTNVTFGVKGRQVSPDTSPAQ